jgi:non-specific protein-tyrosine kinase
MSRLKKALEKAKEARGESGEPKIMKIEPAAPPEAASAKEPPAQTQDGEPLKLLYKSTKTVNCDASLLKKNNVIAVCTEEGGSTLKILRTQVLNRISEDGKKTLLVTSANHGEGKTLTAINLAISFAHQLDKTVLLVDTDIGKPSIQKFFGLQDLPGLSDYLIGQCEIGDVLINPGIERFVMLPAGRPLTNSAELLGSLRMQMLLREMKERYADRFIIFDSAPVLTSADPLVLAGLVDAILVVVEAEKTTREDVKKVFDMMKNRPIIGTVFNKMID